jgi:hypothetical protein
MGRKVTAANVGGTKRMKRGASSRKFGHTVFLSLGLAVALGWSAAPRAGGDRDSDDAKRRSGAERSPTCARQQVIYDCLRLDSIIRPV